MEKLKRLIEHYGNNTHLEVTENAEHYAIAVEELWRKEYSQSGAGAVNKAQLLSTVLSSMRELDHLNETCRKALLDALRQRLFKNKEYKPKRSKPIVDSKVVAAKSLIDNALAKADTLLLNEKGLTANKHLFLALIYAAMESGLCFAEGLEALYQRLIASDEVLVKIGDFWIIELHYIRSNHETNTRENGRAWTIRPFHPGPLTLLAIEGFMKCKPMVCIESSAMTLFKAGLAELTGNQELTKIKNSRLLRACGMLIREQPGSSMGSFLMHYATGDVSSASTSRESLLCLNTQKFQKKPLRIKKDSTAIVYAPAKRKTLKKKEIPAHDSEFNRGLRELFKSVHRRNGSKAAYANEVVDALDEFSKNRRNDFSERAQLLFDWLRHNFQTHNLSKFSSGARYLSSVATIWLDVCERIAVCALEQDEINDLYDVLIERGKLSDKQYPELVESFMRFLHEQKDIDLPIQLVPEDEIKKPHVRSNLAAPRHLDQLLVDINDVYSESTFHIRESILVMLILMMRHGLRPAEVCNIQMKDISLLGKGHVFIRENRHFKEKSSSARRQLELDTLLQDREINLVRKFIKRRMTEEKMQVQADGRVTVENKTGLLFTKVVGYNVFFDMRELSGHVTRLLTSYSGVRTVMYQLRHAAQTSLALVALGSDRIIKKFTPYSPEKARQIKAYLQPSDSFNTLYKVSSVAGHLDSSITLSTYCHMTDLLLYEAIVRKSKLNDLSLVKALSRVQHAKLQKLSTASSCDLLNTQELAELAERVLESERGSWAKVLPTKNLKERNPVMSRIFNVAPEFTADSVSFILKSFDNGLGINEISKMYNVESRMVSCVINTAERLKHLFLTKRRRFRLYEADSKKLSVADPVGFGEISEAIRILQKLMPRSMEKLPKELRKIIYRYLRSAMYEPSYIPIHSPQEVQAILEHTKTAVPSSRWLLSIEADHAIEDRVLNDYWGGVSEDVGEFRINRKQGGMRQNPEGLGYLFFLRNDLTDAMLQNMQKKKYGQHSSRALIKAFHELAVYSGALRQYSTQV